LRRTQWLQTFLDKAEPDFEIGMEACTGAPALLDDNDICALEDDID
jgi:hypothetical protein